MKFAIRDDDISYFTGPEELIAAYRSLWGKLPISLSVVPFISGKCIVVRENEDKLPSKQDKLRYMAEIEKTRAVLVRSLGRRFYHEETFPIGQNKRIVNFLKEEIAGRNVCVLLHGYSHSIYPEGYEFEVGKNLYTKVKDGRECLERLFGVEVKSFVPPNNTLSKEGIRAVVLNGMRVLTSGRVPLWNGVHSKITIPTLSKVVRFKLRYGKRMNYPFVRNFSNFKLFYCHTLGYSTPYQHLKNGIDIAVEFNGSFCIATHYYALLRSNHMRGILLKLIDYAENHYGNQVRYVMADEIFEE